MYAFSLLVIILGPAFAVPPRTNRIVGGTPTTIEEYPYMANTGYGVFGVWWYQGCGGSVINTRSILSAAHCYFGDQPWGWRVRLGSTFASSGGVIYDVQQLILHPQYNHAMLDNDIAIVRLTTNAVMSNMVQPARIAGPNYNPVDGTTVTALGWGAQMPNGPPSEVLRRVDINIINQQLCAERYAFLKTQPGFERLPDVNDNMLCAGILDVGGKDTCQGDSGGPLSHDGDIVVGITSWGFRCGDPVYPGVSARVSRYTNWIVATA